MKYRLCLLLAGLLASAPLRGQVTITADDLFNQPGQYYLAYSNDFDPTAFVPTPYPVPSGTIGSAGPNQFWDFSKGPTNVVYRFDYLAPGNVPASVTADYPQAQIVERKTDQANGKMEYLFFSQVPGVGRTVYGAYSESFLSLIDPSHVFVTPIVDFPDTISYGQAWTTVAVYVNNVSGTDPTDTIDPEDPFSGGFSIALQVTQTSDLKVDAWGTIVLPDSLGSFGQGLRINESVTIDTAVDDGSGAFQHVETDSARNYYWLMPGRGIVAALASTQGANGAPVSENFTAATQFWRMFQTNKKLTPIGPGCQAPDPVAEFRIRYNGGQVLLTWGKANCASQYRVEYSSNASDPASWKPLSGSITNQLFLLDNASLDRQRFYRVISMK